MRFSLSLLNTTFFVSTAFLTSAACGQNEFVSPDQSVNRVIKLRSSEMAQQAAEKVASETFKIESSARKAFSNPALIKFEDIKKVPPALRQEKPMFTPDTAFVSPPVPDTTTKTVPKVSNSWNFSQPQPTPINTGPLTAQVPTASNNGVAVQAANNIQTQIRLPKLAGPDEYHSEQSRQESSSKCDFTGYDSGPR